ncbi:MAG: hypothetical protein AMS27_12540 [Bacteroides sp. SM23_62_1]|nr:MAG: hypothetical protein AMS27_12540 [Bacteroides sp. SM23_62_1]
MRRSFLICIIWLVISVHLPAQELPVETVIQRGHTSSVKSIAISQNGDYIVTGSADNLVKLWDARTGIEMRTFSGHSGWVGSVDISPDNRLVASGAADLMGNPGINIWNIESGEKVFDNAGDSSWISDIVSFSPDGKIFASGGMAGRIKLWDVQTWKEIAVIKLDNHFLSGVTFDFSPDGTYLAIGSKFISFTGEKKKYPGYILLWDVSAQKEIKRFEGHRDAVDIVKISHDGRYLLSVSSESDNGEYNYHFILWDIATGNKIKEIKDKSEEIAAIAFYSKGNMLAYPAGNSVIEVINIQTGRKQHQIKNAFTDAMAFSDDGSYLITAHYGIQRWNLPEFEMIYSERKQNSLTSFGIHPGGKVISCGTFDMENEAAIIKVIDISTAKILTTFTAHEKGIYDIHYTGDGRYLLTSTWRKKGGGVLKIWDDNYNEINEIKAHENAINCFDISPDNQLIATGSHDDQVILWDLNSGELLKKFSEHTKGLETVMFSPDGSLLATAGHDKKIIVRGLPGGEIKNILEGHNGVVNSLAFTPDGKLLASGSSDKTIILWKIPEGEKWKSLEGNLFSVTSVAVSPDGTIIANGASFISGVFGGETGIRLWDISSGNQVSQFAGNPEGVTDVRFSPDGKYLYNCGHDIILKAYDLKAGREVANIIPIEENDFAIITPDNYYSTSKNASKSIVYVKGLNIYTFENFDLIFNRPDIITERLGQADPALVASYHKAYLKRLQKMGFNENQISTEMHLPEVQIINNDVSGIVASRDLSFQIKATDTKYKLDRINVYVNDVPVFGMEGISFKERNVSEILEELQVRLSWGSNKVQFSVHNEKGAESLRQTLNLKYEANPPETDLYLISIGVSEYKDKEFNLNYAAKDATDLAAVLEKQKGRFRYIHSYKILNENASRENIKGIKNELMKSKVDDMVILFVAGHGVLDENLDYCFATHDMDFLKPADRGLLYEELEDLLDGIPARKKLMLIDACHSGEVDKEEEMYMVQEVTTKEGLVFRGSMVRYGSKPGIGLNNSFELMKELFADLRRGTGAVVISSAAGGEYAMEGEQWNNGVFTYSVIEGIETGNADLNKDGKILVSELQEYVFKNVSNLTGGRQNPTFRRENLEFDFQVY